MEYTPFNYNDSSPTSQKIILRKSIKGESETISSFGGIELQVVACVRGPTPLGGLPACPFEEGLGRRDRNTTHKAALN